MRATQQQVNGSVHWLCCCSQYRSWSCKPRHQRGEGDAYKQLTTITATGVESPPSSRRPWKNKKPNQKTNGGELEDQTRTCTSCMQHDWGPAPLFRLEAARADAWGYQSKESSITFFSRIAKSHCCCSFRQACGGTYRARSRDCSRACQSKPGKVWSSNSSK